jgi:Protein of unknown function (DUF4011)
MSAPENNITATCIDRWKRYLLDLTGRNRALYYQPARTTVTVFQDPEPTWKTLVEDGFINLDRTSLLTPSVNPDDEARLEEEANRRIKGISEVARVFIDEQGVHVTHAVFGWLQWVDDTRPPRPREETVTLRSGKEARLVRSPLLFVPVTIERKRNSARALLERNAAIESNITLEYVMTSLFGIDIQLDPDADLDPITVIRVWQQAIQGREHWRVDPGTKVVIDTFSFKKIALLRELEHSQERIEKQPVLRSLCGDATALLESPPYPLLNRWMTSFRLKG